jgi:predicted ester cyclase
MLPGPRGGILLPQAIHKRRQTMTSSEKNKATVRACFENASQGNLDALDEIVAPDYVLHPEEVRGVDGLKGVVDGYRNALSGLRVRIDQQFTEGDYVATRFTIRGTHDGELMGAPPTGKDVAFTGITISRCESGRIVEEWEITDAVGLLGQIGALPELAQS